MAPEFRLTTRVRLTAVIASGATDVGRSPPAAPRPTKPARPPWRDFGKLGRAFRRDVLAGLTMMRGYGDFARTRKGEDFWQTSLKLPSKHISGTAGAGDAFCAGVLWGLHECWDLQRSLLTAVCIAAASLSDATCTAGVQPLKSSLALAHKFGFRPALEPKN